MKILNKEYYELMKEFRDNNDLQNDLNDEECICFANVFNIFSDITENQLSFDEMFQVYGFISDVVYGSRQDIMIINDEYRDIYRLLKNYSITKKLDDEIIKIIAFLLYHFLCVAVMDEKTMEPVINMAFFEKGTENFIEEYRWELKEYPSKYEIKKSLSDPSKDDYGLSVDNPIEVVSIGTQYEYLSLLITEDGKKIIYSREGSTMHNDGKTFIDIWDIYQKTMFGKKLIATLFISGYGSENSTKAPKGFRFMTEDERNLK